MDPIERIEESRRELDKAVAEGLVSREQADNVIKCATETSEIVVKLDAMCEQLGGKKNYFLPIVGIIDLRPGGSIQMMVDNMGKTRDYLDNEYDKDPMALETGSLHTKLIRLLSITLIKCFRPDMAGHVPEIIKRLMEFNPELLSMMIEMLPIMMEAQSRREEIQNEVEPEIQKSRPWDNARFAEEMLFKLFVLSEPMGMGHLHVGQAAGLVKAGPDSFFENAGLSIRNDEIGVSALLSDFEILFGSRPEMGSGDQKVNIVSTDYVAGRMMKTQVVWNEKFVAVYPRSDNANPEYQSWREKGTLEEFAREIRTASLEG